MKKCGKCKEQKQEQEFTPSHYKRSGGWCRSCRSEFERNRWAERTPEKIEMDRERQRRYDGGYYAENGKEIRARKKRKYDEKKGEVK